MAAVATVDDVHNVDVSNMLRNVDDGVIQCILDGEAACLIGQPWDVAGLRTIGESLVAAHIVSGAIRGANGPTGAVTASSAGGLSRSFAAPGGNMSATDTDWNSTSFGRRYLRLRATLPLTPLALGAC